MSTIITPPIPTDPNSDYDTASTDLFQMLPQPYQSDTNRAVMSNLYNRFLSKTETVHTVGNLGLNNPLSLIPTSIKEETVHRQAYQLQPVMYDKIGSVEHMSSWYDILNNLAAQGVDISNQAAWGNALEFNWVPPIDINKLVNYQDYYWVNPSSPNSQPQYITVKSQCAYANSLVSFYESLIAQYGATFNIIEVTPSTNSLVIIGNFTSLFVPGFVLYVENSTNPQINDSFLTVTSSSYDATFNETTIVITSPPTITNSTADGDITLNEQLQIYQNFALCQCAEQNGGWDILPWDDNNFGGVNNNEFVPPPPLWNVAFIASISYPTLAAWNVANSSPQIYDVWWNTTSDILYILEDPSAAVLLTSWKPVYQNFSLIVAQTTGEGLWDYSAGCATEATIAGLDQWINQNYWVHKNDVTNFSIAQAAQYPIIEYEPNLELNEWISTTYTWQYRSSSLVQWANTTAQPNRLELESATIVASTSNTITLDERFGDMTSIFVPGYTFLVDTLPPTPLTVVSSYFVQQSEQSAFQTIITVTGTVPAVVYGTSYVYPELTSQGDAFTTYGNQWLFIGANTTTAINHQYENQMMIPTITGPIYPSYSTILAPYAEQFTINAAGVTTLNLDFYIPSNSTRSLAERSLVGFNDIRVYVNGIRQYGTYDELGTTFVTGIQFLTSLNQGDVVLFQVGEASYFDFGNYAVPVRMIADDATWITDGSPQPLVSLVQLRLNEQVKTAVNQYPLFDIYNINSTSALIANQIFGYDDGPTGTLYPALGQRVISSPTDGSYEFENYLVQSNDGVMYAYRNYDLYNGVPYWYDIITKQLFVWTGETWSTKYVTSTLTSQQVGYWIAPLVLPALPVTTIAGLLVYNTTNNTLQWWNGTTWTSVAVNTTTSDETLETNWRHGLHNEEFVPAIVDWEQRTYSEYQAAEASYIATTAANLITANPSLTQAEATTQATTQWVAIETAQINPDWYTDKTTPLPVTEGTDPVWIGNWQIPDTLYYNVNSEDRQLISLIQLNQHFLSIVDAQPIVPGFQGTGSANWRLIDYTNINWGLGGTIKEYNNSFDTFLSSQFTDEVTPPALFSFAQSEYENMLVTLRQLLVANYVTYMTNTTPAVILDPGDYIANQVLTSYEENEAANLVYGDSTTYTPPTVNTPASGVENWIATLPFFGIIPKVDPYIYQDNDQGISGIVHHDGHRNSYALPESTIIGLDQVLIATPDPRAPGEKFGRVSASLPPINQSVFALRFSSIYRNGVYWLNNNILYRLVLAGVGPTSPAGSYPIGSLWWNTTGTGTLEQQQTLGVWTPVLGGQFYVGSPQTSPISAWQVVDIDQYLLDTILNVETLLYEQCPPPPFTPPINFAQLQSTYPTLWNQYLEQQFIAYCMELQIATPFANNTYNATNPFTWNYKYSTPVELPSSAPYVSGGAWQDVYEKAYGTPYPNLEPWILQGYPDKPAWWDAQWANNDPATYGNRLWAYVHGLQVHAVTPSTITIVGNYVNAFNNVETFTSCIGTSPTMVYSVLAVMLIGGNTVVNVGSTAGITTASQLRVGMWDYILRGKIPTGEVPPLTTIPTWNYVSVNISDYKFNVSADGGNIFEPDDLLPPYWNVAANFAEYSLVVGQTINLPLRSIFTNTSQVTMENADYLWNDSGPIQWMWQQTTNYLYSLVTVAYLIQPIRTIMSIFGNQYVYIDELPVDLLTQKVYSHLDTQFHGEITVNNQIVKINGINQWYVNFNRAHGFDSSYSDFRALWTAWTAPLTYLFGAFIDTTSLSVQQRTTVITPGDYQITMKESPGIANYWIDAFNVNIINIPPLYGLVDTSSDWILQLNSLAPVPRTISYYGVQLYDFYPDPLTSVCSLFTYPIVGASPSQSSFTVDGDVTPVFGSSDGAAQFVVAGSNAGTYTVISSAYNSTTDQTTIVVSEPILSTAASGTLSAINYRTIPWTTGTIVSVSSTDLLPLPLDPTLQYFIIVLSPTTFQFAYNQLDVTGRIPILFTSQGMGIARVGLLYNNFTALNAANVPNVWSHYVIDTSVVNTLQLPANITGFQPFINLIDGYAAYEMSLGFGINVDGSYTDPATGQPVSWQNELERFISWAFQQRSVRRQRINDKYAVDLNYTNGKFTYTSQNPNYLTGSQVVVWSYNGGLPPPIAIGQTYYIIANSDGTVSLASTYTNAIAGVSILPTFVTGIGSLYLSTADLWAAQVPTYEINPFRNALWFSPPEGIVSNILVGPFADIQSTQLVFDQYGRRLTAKDVRVFRQDKITEIQFAGGVYNDVNTVQNNQYNPYQYLHLGGGNIYLDSYEHAMIFNDYTTAGALIYDPFIGLNITQIMLDFYKQSPYTERPNMGGYFLSAPYNQGAKQLINFEGATNNLRYLYDTYTVPDTLPIVTMARSITGYQGVQDYLSEINLNPKSQFLFYKGMIHNKGTINAVTAYANSKLLMGASIDEFWAYKVADYGPVHIPEYLSMWLVPDDTITNNLRLQFVLNNQVCLPGYGVETFGNTQCGYANPPDATTIVDEADPTYTEISMTDLTRWENQPDQIQTLVPDGGVLYFNLEPKQKIVIYPVTLPLPTDPNADIKFNPFDPYQLTDTTSPLYYTNLTDEVGVIVYDPTNSILNPTITEQQNYYTFWTYDSTLGQFNYAGGWNPGALTGNALPILRDDFMADAVVVTLQWYPTETSAIYTIPATPTNTTELTLSTPYLPLTGSTYVFKNGVELQVGIDYVESLELYPGSSVLGYKLYFAQPIAGSQIEVVYGPSQLSQDTQFQIVNTNIISLISQEFITNMFANTNFGTNTQPVVSYTPSSTMTLWGLEVNKEAQNPAYIIDEIAEVVLSPVTFWDPARGYQYYTGLFTVDVQANTDPAQYDTLNGGLRGWKQNQVGITWMDTTNLQYLPYYDPSVITNFNTRISDWGQLSDFGEVNIYEWTQSTVPPDQWNALAAVQEGNNTIDASVRASGTVRTDVRYNDRTYTNVSASPSTQGNTVITFTPAVPTNGAIITTDLTGLAPSIVTPTDETYTATIVVNGTPVSLDVTGSTVSTFSALASEVSSQLVSSGGTCIFTPESASTFTLESTSTGSASTIAITQTLDDIFKNVTGFISYEAPVAGTNATSGHQTVNLTSSPTSNTATGLAYTAPTGDAEYTVGVSTVGLNADANDQQQAWFSTSESRSASGSQLATFADVIALLKTFTNITVTNTATTITLTNTIAAPNASYPSIIAIEDDSLFFALPGLVSIIATEATPTGHGTVVITFSAAFTDTGLAPSAGINPAYSFTISVNGSAAQTISISGSDGQLYGNLITQLNTQLNPLGATAQLSGSSIVVTSTASAGTSSITIVDPPSIDHGLFHSLTVFSSISAGVVGVAATSGYQIIQAGSHLPTDSTGLGPAVTPTSPSYTFTIQVDGTLERTLTYLATQVSTFGDLINVLSPQFALYGATIALSGNTIVITSNTIGTPSAITITENGPSGSPPGLFTSITSNNGGTVTYASQVATPGINQQIVATEPALFTVGDTVLFANLNGALPTGLTQSQVYTISSINLISGVVGITGVTITSAASNFTMGNSVWPTTWTIATQQQVNLDASIDATTSVIGGVETYTFSLNTTTFDAGTVVNVYVDGVTAQLGYTLTSAGLVFPSTISTLIVQTTAPVTSSVGFYWYNSLTLVLSQWNGTAWVAVPNVTVSTTEPSSSTQGYYWFNPTTLVLQEYNGTAFVVVPTAISFPAITKANRVNVILPIPTPTAAQLSFNPAVADDGTMQVQYQVITNYVATQQFDVLTNSDVYTYYFWVQNKTTPPPNSTAEDITQAALDIITPPGPTMFFTGLAANNGMPSPPSLTMNTETGMTINMPWNYPQAVVNGLRGYVDDNYRYVLKFTRDFSLRDKLTHDLLPPLQLKDAHQEWLMFRQHQLDNVPQDLWNKVTESMAGYLINDPTTRVPALNRQLYDQTYGTSTQYGLGYGQSFTNGPTAITTITAYLNDSANNFSPIDMDLFFDTYNFDTPANIIATMNYIYENFGYQNVNAMFFSVLQDALTFQQEYAGLMKTSAIAISGVQMLNVNGYLG